VHDRFRRVRHIGADQPCRCRWRSVQAEGLPPGAHGIHVHAVGRCEAPEFTTAGPHWNPTDRKHGRDNPDGAHHGDLPNIQIGADGRGSLNFVIPSASFAQLFDSDGAALVVHATADDYRTDPSGNSGGRIACGVITRN
jgi:superoxide dismutase, Cu-Zn family